MARRKHPRLNASQADAKTATLALAESLLDERQYADLLAELEKPLLPTLRINHLKLDDPGYAALEARYGWVSEPIAFCPGGRRLLKAATPPSRTIEHRLGFYYIQEAASMLPTELFDLNLISHPLILDMAASPGGKTTHLIDRIAEHGLVVANDSSPDRLTALKLVLQNWGAANAAITGYPGEKLGNWFGGQFDYVLLDAPCSMQGLRGSENHPMRPITAKEQSQLATRQSRLLASALNAVKPGGQVVYSTCTLTVEENEGVLDAMVRQFGTAIEIVDLRQMLPRPAPALTAHAGLCFDPSIAGAARLWPHCYGTAGFFAALINKKEEWPVLSRERPERLFSLTGIDLLADSELKAQLRIMEDRFGVALAPELEAKQLLLARREERLLMLPERWLRDFPTIPYHALGLTAGSLDGGQFDPSLEWLARYHQRIDRGRYTLPQELMAAWLRGEDLPLDLSGSAAVGQVVAVYDEQDRLLGKGKVTRQRLKNHLPARFIQGLAA